MNGTTLDPLRPPLPQDWGFATPPKLQSLLSQERVRLQTSNLADTLQVHTNKNPLQILEKREGGHIRGLPIVLCIPYYIRNG